MAKTTDRMRAGQELRKAHDELEAGVLERTANNPSAGGARRALSRWPAYR